MSKLRERLEDPARSGVYRATRSDAIEEALRGSRLSYARVDVPAAADKTAMLEAIARAMAFPEWFGANWDALEDCLTDLSWREGEGHVLVIAGASALPGDDLGILMDVLDASAGFWKARGKPFFAVILDPPRKLALSDLYREK
jgi:hypothetical protein